MKTIDKLIIKAKKKHGVGRLVNAFIYPSEVEPEKWIADGRIWNGKPGSGIVQEACTCVSKDEALKALEELAEQYPNNENICVFINDLEDWRD